MITCTCEPSAVLQIEVLQLVRRMCVIQRSLKVRVHGEPTYLRGKLSTNGFMDQLNTLCREGFDLACAQATAHERSLLGRLLRCATQPVLTEMRI